MMTHSLSRRHLWTNLVFVFVLLSGLWSYLALPRAQYPEVRLNWVAVATVWPAASARDVERQITLPLEAVVRRAGQVRYVAATSRDYVSTLLVRFEDIPHADFERRLQALVRDVQQAAAAFPRDARPPQVVELTSSSLFPTAMVLVPAEDGDDRLARSVQADMEALPGVDRVWAIGLGEPELAVAFDPAALRRHGVAPDVLARTLAEQAQDVPAGPVSMSGRLYNSRVSGLSSDPAQWAGLPIPDGQGGMVPLGELADIQPGSAAGRERVALADGRPAVLLSVIKRENVNALHLTEAVADYVAARNRQLGGAVLQLADDQTGATRSAIRAMENNALLGLLTVLCVAWLFLGRRMALLVSVGVPFALAAMFLSLYLMGETLNTSVLLGVAIVLGIPLDDAVVVAEAIQIRLAQGHERLAAVRLALGEVARPVLASVLATVAAFAPLMLLPGLLGKFMLVVPLTVILTLLASLAASLWILPSHVVAWRGQEVCPRPMVRMRQALGRGLRRQYGRLLAGAFRHPGRVAMLFLVLLGLVAAGTAAGWLRAQWFASDPLRVFNVNVQMPATAGLDATLAMTREVEARLRAVARPGEVRASLSMAGIQFTPSETRHGDHLGQVVISLADQGNGERSVEDFVAAARPVVTGLAGADNVAFQVLSADLPSLSALTVRLTGESAGQLAEAAQALRQAMAGMAGLEDVQDDSELGKPLLGLALDSAAAARAGLDPMKVAGLIRLHFDGLPVARVADGDTTRTVTLRARDMDDAAVRALLEQPWRLASGQVVRPNELFALEFANAAGQSRRVNYRPAVTIQAGIDRDHLSAATAEAGVRALWEELRAAYPGVTVEFGGELEDVRASLHDLAWLFLLGIVLMYGILALQFGSVVLPLLMLATAPMALIGVALGLMVIDQPLSLYTLYGCVALGGVAMNASIVLIAAARDRSEAGMGPLAATFHAARRRLVPIVITTFSILGGLLALAFGVGGESLLWGPLAAAIVWGMVVATPLTLFATPLLYYRLARRRAA
ncbi:MAG: efflux RND transporter permease subunit [Gallionellaceae bacterium]|nr:efflux RND transporter permease subunit [Gallionellaceae bacterium]